MPESDSTARKRVDEDWKERIEQEQSQPPPAPAGAPEAPHAGAPTVDMPSAEPAAGSARTQETGPVEARFDVFVSGLSMEALIGLGDLPHPTTKKRAVNLPQAKYLIDLLGILEEKTRGNLTGEESQLLQDLLYQLRMRYLAKAETT